MSDRASVPEFDPGAIVRVLQAHGVRFVVIGGLAALAHGSPFPTEDLDITPETSEPNLRRLSEALTELDARIRTNADPDGLPFAHDATSLGSVHSCDLVTCFGDLDIALVPAGTRGYRDLVRGSSDVHAFGVWIPIASLADVIRSKQAAGRPKDQRVLPTLRQLLGLADDAR